MTLSRLLSLGILVSRETIVEAQFSNGTISLVKLCDKAMSEQRFLNARVTKVTPTIHNGHIKNKVCIAVDELQQGATS